MCDTVGVPVSVLANKLFPTLSWVLVCSHTVTLKSTSTMLAQYVEHILLSPSAVPDPLEAVVAVAAGAYHTCAITVDGRLVATARLCANIPFASSLRSSLGNLDTAFVLDLDPGYVANTLAGATLPST